MHHAAYQLGVRTALAEAGFASVAAFAKHAADRATDVAKALNALPAEQFREGVQGLGHADPAAAAQIEQAFAAKAREFGEAAQQLKPVGGGLLDKVRGLWSHEPHVPDAAQWFLTERAPANAPQLLQAGPTAGTYTVHSFQHGNIPLHRAADVAPDAGLLDTPAAADAVRRMRGQLAPGHVLGGAALGGALGAGAGYLTAEPEQDKGRRAAIGGAIGAGAGALGGGLLAALRGGALGRATLLGSDIADQAQRAFAR